MIVAKNLPANTGDIRDVIRSLDQEDSLEEGMVTHFSALAWGNPIDREAWQATVHKVAESDTIEAT